MHENFIFLLKCLNIPYNDEFWNTYICDQNDYESLCWKGKCEKCRGGLKLINSINKCNNEKVVYRNWVKKSDNRLILDIKEECIGKVKEIISMTICKFQEHVRIKRIQQYSFENDKSSEKTHVL